MKPGLILPIQIFFRHARLQSTDAAIGYVREAMETVRRSGKVALVDWAFDPTAPVPVIDGDVYDARVKLLVEGEEKDRGLVLVQLLLQVGDLAGHVGLTLISLGVGSYAIGTDYVPGEAFPPAQA